MEFGFKGEIITGINLVMTFLYLCRSTRETRHQLLAIATDKNRRDADDSTNTFKIYLWFMQ